MGPGCSACARYAWTGYAGTGPFASRPGPFRQRLAALHPAVAVPRRKKNVRSQSMARSSSCARGPSGRVPRAGHHELRVLQGQEFLGESGFQARYRREHRARNRAVDAWRRRTARVHRALGRRSEFAAIDPGQRVPRLQWWTPNGSTILADGTGTITGPLNFTGGFFPTGESSNSNWFRTAIYTGTVNMASPGLAQLHARIG